MSYVKHILLKDERVLYDGHVHPRVLIPGMIWLGFAAWLLRLASESGGGYSWFLRFTYWLAETVPWTAGFYRILIHWQQITPNIAIEIKILALGIALFGFSKLAQGLLTMQSTELIVTDRRVICKVGVMTVTTIEMDRTRIAGVTVEQSLWGRIMGYGYIFIRGFTSSIGGLPVMVKPHLIEQFLA